MAGIDDILALPDTGRSTRVGSGPSQAAPSPKPQAVSGLDGIVNAFAQIEDPMAREIAKGLVETEMSRALGFRFRFPDPAELEQQRRADQILAFKQNRELASMQLEFTRATILDNADAIGKAKGIDPATIPDLIEDPDVLISLSKEVGQPVTRGMMRLAAGKDAELALKSRADVAREKREQTVADLKTTEAGLRSAMDIPKLEKELNPKGQAIKALNQIEDEMDIDIWGVGNSMIDEPRGAIGMHATMDLIERTAPGPAGTAVLAKLLEVKADDIQDQLEELVDDEGVLRLPEKNTGEVKAEAAFWLAALLDKMAIRLGVPRDQVYQRVGLQTAGPSDEEMTAAARRVYGGLSEAQRERLSFEDWARQVLQ